MNWYEIKNFRRAENQMQALQKNSISGKIEWGPDNRSHIFALVEDVR